MGYDLDFNQIEGDSYDRSNDGLHQLSVELSEILDLTRTPGNIAVTDVETDLFLDDAPTKLISGRSIKIDTSVIEAADTYDFRVYYRIESGGSLKAASKATKSGVQSEPIYIITLDDYRYGMKITGQRTGGANRVFPIEAIRET